MRPKRNSVFLLGFVFGLLITAPGLFAQDEKPVFEEWVVLVLDGKQCGFGSTITTRIDGPTGPQFKTVAVQEFVVKRLDTDMKISETTKTTEDADGGVLSFDELTSTFGSDVDSTGVRDGDDLVVSSRGETQRYHLPRLDALGPEKIRQMSNALPLKPNQPFSFQTFAAEYPQAIVVQKGNIIGQETRNVRGTDRKLWKISSEMSMMPGVVSNVWVDDQNNDVEAVTSIPGIGDLHEFVTNRAECMKQPEGAEIFAPSLIHPDKALPSPADQGQAVYRLTVIDPGKNFVLWNEGEQRILSTGPGTCEVEVTNQPIEPDAITWQLPHADTPELHPYLQASTYLESNSPEIQALAKQAVGDEKNPVRAAHLIETFVRAYITKKDLNIGFASAQETAKSREGDCTEHSVLCAAIGRAAGLPTRCVVGFGYIPPGMDEPAVSDQTDADTGIFGFHMWAEAWVGPDQWVPMDAALNGFDVGHIAIAKTALSEINPLIDLNMPVLQLMQNLTIEIEKIVPKSQMPKPALPLKPVEPASVPVTNPSPAPVASPPPVTTQPSLPPVD
jgi:hypothetical protein